MSQLSGTGDLRKSIRANHSRLKPLFYSASGRFARITRISDSRESPYSRESCASIRANHATKRLKDFSVSSAFLIQGLQLIDTFLWTHKMSSHVLYLAADRAPQKLSDGWAGSYEACLTKHPPSGPSPYTIASLPASEKIAFGPPARNKETWLKNGC